MESQIILITDGEEGGTLGSVTLGESIEGVPTEKVPEAEAPEAETVPEADTGRDAEGGGQEDSSNSLDRQPLRDEVKFAYLHSVQTFLGRAKVQDLRSIIRAYRIPCREPRGGGVVSFLQDRILEVASERYETERIEIPDLRRTMNEARQDNIKKREDKKVALEVSRRRRGQVMDGIFIRNPATMECKRAYHQALSTAKNSAVRFREARRLYYETSLPFDGPRMANEMHEKEDHCLLQVACWKSTFAPLEQSVRLSVPSEIDVLLPLATATFPEWKILCLLLEMFVGEDAAIDAAANGDITRSTILQITLTRLRRRFIWDGGEEIGDVQLCEEQLAPMRDRLQQRHQEWYRRTYFTPPPGPSSTLSVRNGDHEDTPVPFVSASNRTARSVSYSGPNRVNSTQGHRKTLVEQAGLLSGQKDERLEKEDETKQCIICFENKKCVMVDPCHHVLYCNECAIHLFGQEGTSTGCSLCKTKVEGLIRVYW